jgi:tRNA(fMet)-specific endonuclease VapC
MGIILDTSVLIAWERHKTDLQAFVERRADESFALTSITAAELLHGVHRAQNQARRVRRSAYVEKLLTYFPLYDFDLAAARIYAEVWARLEQQGRKVSAHDLMIAATALARGFSVATFNERDYRKIEELSLELIHE